MRQTDPGGLVIRGDLTRGNVVMLVRYLRKLNSGADLALDLSGLEIEDVEPLVLMVNLLRELRERVQRLTVKGAPQLLGHNLYRANLLAGPRAIELIETREDQAYG